MAKLFQKRRAELPTGAVLIHANRFKDKPWNILVQREKNGKAYVAAIQACIDDPTTQQTFQEHELRPVNLDYLDDDTTDYNEETDQYEGKALEQLTEATLLLFYGRDEDFLRDIKIVNQRYDDLPMTAFVFQYPIVEDDHGKKRVENVEVQRYNNDDIKNDKVVAPKLTFKAPHDSADFRHLTYVGLTKIAWQPKSKEPNLSDDATPALKQ